MAIEQDVFDELLDGQTVGEPKKHIITFTHEEWLKLQKGFNGINEPKVFKNMLLKLADGGLKLVKPKVSPAEQVA
jgi:hypothetical protein